MWICLSTKVTLFSCIHSVVKWSLNFTKPSACVKFGLPSWFKLFGLVDLPPCRHSAWQTWTKYFAFWQREFLAKYFLSLLDIWTAKCDLNLAVISRKAYSESNPKIWYWICTCFPCIMLTRWQMDSSILTHIHEIFHNCTYYPFFFCVNWVGQLFSGS